MASTEEELVKKILKVPTLPKTVQGDGRYLMTLLNSFLLQTAEQINLANGFSAEEIHPQAGKYPTPRDFFLSFNRLGGTWTWTHIADVSNLAYYELRTDTNVGMQSGLLERTVLNSSTAMPVEYAATVYLYAVSKDKEVSGATSIAYTKPRPDAPKDIATTKTNEGTLITFLEIPSNCIGANIYIDGKLYKSYDNIFLAQGIEKIKRIEIAYYDQFGEGERGQLNLILPDITGFLVERNGPELDFYWDAVNVYGVKYLVKVGPTPSWEQATELFRTETNDKNRRLYPNKGVYYLLVKAYDDNGNYSENAAYQVMNTVADISRNIILEFNQNDVLYNGTKINCYYEPTIEGVTLNREAKYGEYIFNVSLDQKYRARNWLEYSLISASDNNLMWIDADFSWDDANFAWAGIIGDVDSSGFRTEIAMKQPPDVTEIFIADLNGNLKTEQEENPVKTQHADDYRSGRWGQGLYIEDLTMLEYDISLMTNAFSMVFFLKTTKLLGDCSLVTLTTADDNGYLRLGYDARLKEFYLKGSDGAAIGVPYDGAAIGDYFTFGISQSLTEGRSLYVNSLNTSTTYSGADETATPIGVFKKLYAYPKIIL